MVRGINARRKETKGNQKENKVQNYLCKAIIQLPVGKISANVL
jgi:hypothetical protein